MSRRLGVSSFILATILSGGVASAQPAPPPAKPSYVVEGGLLKLPTAVTFEDDTARLSPSADGALAYIAQYLADTSYVTLVRVEGHVAAGAKGAQALSERRALAVARALVARGVACERLIPVGFGDAKPVAPDGAAANTRIEVAPAHLKGRAIGGMPADGGGLVAGDPCAK